MCDTNIATEPQAPEKPTLAEVKKVLYWFQFKCTGRKCEDCIYCSKELPISQSCSINRTPELLDIDHIIYQSAVEL